MKIYRFERSGDVRWGALRGEALVPLTGSIFENPVPEGEPIPIGEVRVLAPVQPSKIVAVGRNYREHAEEMGNAPPVEPLLFLKPSTAVIGPRDAILYPAASSRVDYEGELAVVIRKTARGLSDAANVVDYILGCTCLNDVTARDLQEKDKQFTRAKSFDTFAPLGPCLVRFISRIMTLLPGDVITTGTPAGVGPMQPGDRVDVQIEGIGTLSNEVRKIE